MSVKTYAFALNIKVFEIVQVELRRKEIGKGADASAQQYSSVLSFHSALTRTSPIELLDLTTPYRPMCRRRYQPRGRIECMLRARAPLPHLYSLAEGFVLQCVEMGETGVCRSPFAVKHRQTTLIHFHVDLTYRILA